MGEQDRFQEPGSGKRPGVGASQRLWASLLIAAGIPGCAASDVLLHQNPAVRLASDSKPPVTAPPSTTDSRTSVTATTGKQHTPPAAKTTDASVKTAQAQLVTGIPKYDPKPVVPPSDREFPIDLTSALRLAEVENPVIAGARQQIGEALALQLAAYSLMLPTLNAGTMYHGHTGNLQRSSGQVLNLSEQSLYFGGGTRTVAAESLAIPAVNITSSLTDAIFEPLAAQQNVASARATASATANTVLLDVSKLYLDLVAAEATLWARRRAVSEGMEVARLTRAYAESGQGRDADARRAGTELALLEREAQHAEEEVAVVATRLAQRLHLEQTVRLRIAVPGIFEVTLVDPEIPLPELIQSGVQRRPEVAARTADVAGAQAHLRQEIARPLLPNLWLGMSGGAFGGGSNIVPPLLGNFSGRTDFDVRVFWTFQNFGFGNLNLQRRRRAQVGQALAAQAGTVAQVRTEVSAAYADVIAARQRVKTTRLQLASAEGGFFKDLTRIRNEVGRPINVVNSLRLLNDARVAHIAAVTDYDQAQFRLYVALGSPPPLDRPVDEPLPEAPIAAPPLPPLVSGTPPSQPQPAAPTAENHQPQPNIASASPAAVTR